MNYTYLPEYNGEPRVGSAVLLVVTITTGDVWDGHRTKFNVDASITTQVSFNLQAVIVLARDDALARAPASLNTEDVALGIDFSIPPLRGNPGNPVDNTVNENNTGVVVPVVVPVSTDPNDVYF